MNFYIATKLENHAQHNKVRDFCRAVLGWEITYDWSVHGPVFRSGLERVREVAQAEMNGVTNADVVIVLWPGGRGTHVELGAAIVAGKRIFLMSEVADHHEATQETCAFYHHPSVTLSRNEWELTDQLENLKAEFRAPAGI